jgi:hypothetical protein
MARICPECLENYSGKRCSCGYGDTGNTIPPPPKVCSVTGCDNDTAVNSVVLREAGKTFIPQSALRFMNGSKLQPGYEFVRHITRCAECFHREQGPGWRDEMIAAQLTAHPEFKEAQYSDDVDRGDIIAIVKKFARTKKAKTVKTLVDEDVILTGRVTGDDQIATVDTAKYLRV